MSLSGYQAVDNIFLRPGVDLGYCLYPVSLMNRASGKQEVLYVTSDRELLSIDKRFGRCVLLNNGTSGTYVEPIGSTWTFNAVERYLNNANVDIGGPQLIEQIVSHLKESVWLSHVEDFYLVAALIVLSYYQNLFSALPFFAIGGDPGSGKTTLASLVDALSFNSMTMGRITVPALARAANGSGGIIVLDDAETIGKAFSPVNQLLKVGYRKQSSIYTISSRASIQSYDVFGIRIFSSIRPLDEVLGSRCIDLNMTKAAGVRLREPDYQALHQIRQDLHTFAMSKWSLVRKRVLGAENTACNRWSEITYPLTTIAKEIGSQGQYEALTLSLGKRKASDNIDDAIATIFDQHGGTVSSDTLASELKGFGFNLSRIALGRLLKQGYRVTGRRQKRRGPKSRIYERIGGG